MNNITFSMTSDVQSLGVRGTYFIIRNLHNRANDTGFDDIKSARLTRLLDNLSEQTITEDRILQGFSDLHNKVGKTGKKYISSPENLLRYVCENREFPHVNLLVDIYNLVSLESRLALGAHDMRGINGNVNLRITNGTESFCPLGYSKTKTASKGEYAYVDDKNDVLCQMEIRQVEKTKITIDTTDAFYIIQGNDNTDRTAIASAMQQLLMWTKQFCGGEEEILYSS